MPVDRRERPLAEPGAGVAAVADRVERLDELKALAVLAKRLLAGDRAVDLVRRPRVQPDRHPVLHVRRDLPDADRADQEEAEAGGHIRHPRRRDVEHRQEDPEVEEAAAEVSRLEQDEHRQRPDHEQRAPVLQPPLREDFALLAHVAREEDDQRDLRELARLEPQRPEVHPEPRAVHGQPQHGQDRQEQQSDRGQPEDVLVRLELAVVVAEQEERQREKGDRDDDPGALLECVARMEAVDLRQPDRRQEAGDRQQVRIRERHRVTGHEMSRQVEQQEEACIRERRRRDDVLPCDVDTGEPDRRQHADDDQEQKLPVAKAQRRNLR